MSQAILDGMVCPSCEKDQGQLKLVESTEVHRTVYLDRDTLEVHLGPAETLDGDGDYSLECVLCGWSGELPGWMKSTDWSWDSEHL